MGGITVRLWSGWEARALREAKRMSIRTFAAHLGVSDRMISKWEAGGKTIFPRPVNQAALDTSLACSSAEVQIRFSVLLGNTIQSVAEQSSAERAPLPLQQNHQVRHPVDGRLMAFIDEGVFLSGLDNEPVYLPAFYIDVFPTSNADYAHFIAATGHRPPEHWNKYRTGRPPDELFDHPVVFVTWRDASAHATWATNHCPPAFNGKRRPEGHRETFILGVIS